jgi:3-deoxy-D-manno-octulosonate 8-phosphate phosphatase (KDO 8-P phosphatase)
MKPPRGIISALKSVKLLSCDVDGVLTDGGLYYDEEGREIRRFHVLDGLGLQNLMDNGVHVCIISRSKTKAIYYRAKALGIKHCYLGVKDKMDTMRQLLKDLNLDISEVAHIGDDLNDLELLLAVGLPITVPKAVKEVKEIALLITEKNGGEGAVREVTDKIISSKKNSN